MRFFFTISVQIYHIAKKAHFLRVIQYEHVSAVRFVLQYVGSTFFTESAAMPVYRTTWFFNWNKMGWTENIHHTGTSLDDVVGAVNVVAPLRRQMLSAGCILEGVRISDDEIPGDSSFVLNLAYGPGLWNEDTDAIWNALLVRIESGPLNRRLLYLSGIPDVEIERGVKDFDPIYFGKMRAYIDGLVSSHFGIRTLSSVGNPWVNVAVISADGLVSTTAAHGFGVGNFIKFRRLGVKPKPRSPSLVADPITTSTFTVVPWSPRPGVVARGQVKRYQYTVIPFTRAIAEGIVKKSRGRAFFVPAGRRKVQR